MGKINVFSKTKQLSKGMYTRLANGFTEYLTYFNNVDPGIPQGKL